MQTLTNTSNHTFEIQADEKPINLTRREAQCLYHLIKGMSSKHIARCIGISHRTVEIYCDNIRRKAGAINRIALLGSINNINTIKQWQFAQTNNG